MQSKAEAEKLIEQADSYYDNGNAMQARELYDQARHHDPENATAWLMLGAVNAETGAVQQGVEYINEALRLKPDFVDAYITLAHIYIATSRKADAIRCLQNALENAPQDHEALIMLGGLYVNAERFVDARDCFQQALAVRPDDFDAQLMLAWNQFQLKEFDQAKKSYGRATELNPGSVDAWYGLGQVLFSLAEYEAALAAFNKVLGLNPGYAEAYLQSAYASQGLNEHRRAVELFERVLSMDPKNIAALNGRGYSLLALGQLQQAMQQFDHILSFSPGNSAAEYGRASVYLQQGRLEQAEGILKYILENRSDYIPAYINLATLYQSRGQIDAALQVCEQALTVNADAQEIITAMAYLLARQGRFDVAAEKLQPVLERGIENAQEAIAYAETARFLQEQDRALQVVESMLADSSSASSYERKRLRYSAGKLSNAIGQYDRAFQHYQAANKLAMEQLGHKNFEEERAVYNKSLESLISVYSHENLAQLNTSGNDSSVPIFIVGMPRSGTTLIEQVLSSHPDVYGAGELTMMAELADNLPTVLGSKDPYPHCIQGVSQQELDKIAADYIDRLQDIGQGARHVVDKMPNNFELLGLISALFPSAKVIHCMREPLDTCLSIYFQEFTTSSLHNHDLNAIGYLYQRYEKLMRHWKQVIDLPILDVRYENVVTDTEKQVRRLLDFCGLEWDEQCLKFYESDRHVRTASYDQVRQPIYTSSLRRWKNYAPYLDDLQRILSEQGD